MQQQVWKWQDNTFDPSGTGIQSIEYSQAISEPNTARIPSESVIGY